MESLHRQVLPFLLRRLKEDVLQDLPPKIIQDYYCELSPLQVGFQELAEEKITYVSPNLLALTDLAGSPQRFCPF